MPAFIVARVDVTDPEKFKKYQFLTPNAISTNGGKFIARGGKTVTLEGAEAARAFWDSPEYAEAKAARENAADFQAFIVEGV